MFVSQKYGLCVHKEIVNLLIFNFSLRNFLNAMIFLDLVIKHIFVRYLKERC